jgi:hypothetical protein
MFICENHFLLPFTCAAVDKRLVTRLTGVDTTLMIGMRLVGYDSSTGRPVIDLVKVDEVLLDVGQMPDGLTDLLPDWIQHSGQVRLIDSSESTLENVLEELGIKA